MAAHKRNLTDDMIREMVRRECLIGLNYFVAFLRDDRNVESLDDLYRHVDHFLSLGAEKCLALGSDFDGAQLPECLDSPAKAAGIYEYLLSRNIPEPVPPASVYQNALDFFHKTTPVSPKKTLASRRPGRHNRAYSISSSQEEAQ